VTNLGKRFKKEIPGIVLQKEWAYNVKVIAIFKKASLVMGYKIDGNN
jgi:hypothetical protein